MAGVRTDTSISGAGANIDNMQNLSQLLLYLRRLQDH